MITPSTHWFRSPVDKGLVLTIFAAVFILTLVIGTLTTFIEPETYASTARIVLDSDNGNTAGQPTNTTLEPTHTELYSIQAATETILSEPVLAQVVSNLNLNVVWGKKYFDGEVLKTGETVVLLKAYLGVTPAHDHKLVSITAYSDDKNEAASLANAVAESSSDYTHQQAQKADARANLSALQARYDQEKSALATALIELDAQRQSLKPLTNSTSAAPKFVHDQTDRVQSFLNRQRQLNEQQAKQDLLFLQIEQARIALKIPSPPPLSVADLAVPSQAPVRPNKPLNIFLSAVMGIVLGAAAGGAVVELACFRRRKQAI